MPYSLAGPNDILIISKSGVGTSCVSVKNAEKIQMLQAEMQKSQMDFCKIV